MAITWGVDPTRRYAVMTVADPFTIEDWRITMLSIVAAPIARPRLALLIDRRHSEPITTRFVDEMSLFFEQHRKALANSLVAIVVSDDAGFEMGRMTALQNALAMIRTFRNYEDAVTWLT